MFNDIDNNSYNSIILHTNSRNKKRKIMCVICYPKVELDLVKEDEGKWKCPRCKNDYFILGHEGDLVPEEDELISSHDNEDEDPVLVTADYTVKPEPVLNSHKPKSDIKIPWYFQDTETTKVTHYRED